jgi:Cu(I)/Ag(I) efflux system membrane fusion protein
MKAVKIGPLAAGDLYPVLEGLAESDRVVTVGTFLVDAEDRLNPTAAVKPAQAEHVH